MVTWLSSSVLQVCLNESMRSINIIYQIPALCVSKCIVSEFHTGGFCLACSACLITENVAHTLSLTVLLELLSPNDGQHCKYIYVIYITFTIKRFKYMVPKLYFNSTFASRSFILYIQDPTIIQRKHQQLNDPL